MTPKEEVIAALLNNANISEEAMNYLNEALGESEGTSSGGLFIVNVSEGRLDKTWQEIYDASTNGKYCIIKENIIIEDYGMFSITEPIFNIEYTENSGHYVIIACRYNEGDGFSSHYATFSCESASDYPESIE